MNNPISELDDRLMTVPKAAKATGIGAHCIRQAIKDGMPTIKVGNSRELVSRRILFEWGTRHNQGNMQSER